MAASDKEPNPKSIDHSIPDDTILKIAKEIVVKFIEVGRITPTTFDSSFRQIYHTIDSTVHNK